MTALNRANYVINDKTFIQNSPMLGTLVTNQNTTLKLINSSYYGDIYDVEFCNDELNLFKKQGQSVKKGDLICNLFAMNSLFSIRAEVSGIFQDYLEEEGEPIEFNQPLFTIRLI